jgi:hypothetical protein
MPFEEAVEQLEGHCRHGEEVKRDEHLPVIRQEGAPGVAGITAAPDSAGNEPPFVRR